MPTPTAVPTFSRGALLTLALLAATYAFFLGWYHSPYAGGSDSSGYMNSARLMLEGRLTDPLRLPAGMPADLLPPQLFVPLGFTSDPTGQHWLPSYPPGLPLHFALLGWLIGLGPATTAIGVGSALAFALLLYFTGREFGLQPNWSLALALLGALSPLTVTYALQPMSDLVAAVWGLATMLFALRSRRHIAWAVAAGAALALAVLVRPTNALFFLPAALALQPSLRHGLAFVLGGVPGALLLALYNRTVYGQFVASGYGDMSHLFSLANVPHTLWHYARWLPAVATPLVLAALALPWQPIPRRLKAVLLTWVAAFLLFYSFYDCTSEHWWYLRFILPALPAVGLAAALVLQRINFPSWFLASRLLPANATPDQLVRGRILRAPVTLLLLLAAAGWLLDWGRTLRVTQVELDERTYALTGRWIADHLPADAVLVAMQVSGNAYYYANRPCLDPNFVTPENYARLNAWLAAHRRPLYAVTHEYEEPTLRQNLPGRWDVVTRLRQATVWRRVDPSPAAPSS